jgi:zinc D-Ala-D-Ala carboxypeptidase
LPAYGKAHTVRQRRSPCNGGVPYTESRRIRIRGIRVAGLLLAVVAIAAVLGHQPPDHSSSTPTASATPGVVINHEVPPSDVIPREHAHTHALGEADGAVPDGTTVFDEDVPGVARLDPDLLQALRRAAGDAAAAGVTFVVDSGWRSPAYQRHLLEQAVAEYGSRAEAARWVATPRTSAHVSGDAVDLAGAGTTDWLAAHGADYGLCRVYANEPWHVELRPQAVGHGCPPPYADPTHDPRMQR